MASAGPLSLRSNCDMAAAARRKPALTTWLDSTIVPVFVVDSRRRIVFFNHGCEQLTGWTRDLVLGRVCDYASGDDHTRVETLTSSLCPPSEVFAGRALTTPLAVIDRSGESHSRFLHYIPLIDDDQHVDRAAGLITRIDHPIRLAEPSMSQRLHAELAAARASLRSRYDVRSLVCRSDAMNRVAEQIALAVPSLVPVCLAGESGTGREHVARVIHGQSETGDRAFVPLDCSAMCAFELEQSLRRLRADLEETSRPRRPAARLGLVRPRKYSVHRRSTREFRDWRSAKGNGR